MSLGVRFGLFLAALSCVYLVSGVDRNNFKTCEQSSFCRRCRKVEPGKTPYKLLNTVEVRETDLSGELFNQDTGVAYILRLTGLADNTYRVWINEKNPLHPRFEATFALQSDPVPKKIQLIEQTAEYIVVGTDHTKAKLFFNPFRIDFYRGEQLVLSANARGLMRFEHIRTKPEPKPEGEEGEKPAETNPEFPGDGADSDPGAWEENFKSHHDSKPFGPEAVALDFSFIGAENVYGVPEHAGSFALKSTKKSDPYRLYNLDVFEYEIDDFMSLYGAIPVVFGHGKESGTSGVYWQNAAETWVDITSSADNNVVESIVNFVSGSAKKPQVDAHFISESGLIDAFFMLGPSPLDAFRQYTRLTGSAPLPQMFSLGYHQCRWNYNDQDDVRQVAENFDKYDLPMDVMWLDIEYTDGKKYFTWDTRKFSQPLEMVHNLTEKGRKLVVIIDPHIKRDQNYFLHNDATNLGYYVKHRDGKDYEGWCWPGATSYIDMFDPKVRQYYIEQYNLDKFTGTTNDVYIWNDMNEPSVFNGPEVTMPKDLIHYENWEHRDIHNINGMMFTSATHEALFRRSGGSLRPFVLTRSFFAGSQRYGAMWTGDNTGEWNHLRISYPMCLSLAVSGFSFCGADIGGFFKNPDNELFIRWNQAAAWLPFMRQHSHIETKRREPWVFGDNTLGIVRETLKRRYAYLPLWYTLFREHEISGIPVIRPIWAHYPTESAAFTIDDEILVGDSLLVRPVLEPGLTEVSVYFPGEDKITWYNIDTMQPYKQPGAVSVPVTMERIPVYQRSGSIVPKKNRSRRSTVAMKNDPYTLMVIADDDGSATGTLYIDDESSFEYRHGKYLYIRFTLTGYKLTSNFMDKLATYDTKSWLERIDIANPPKNVKSAQLTSKTLGIVELEAKYNTRNNVLTVRKPGVNMGEEWSIELIH
ncbi:neutral alpha-glucosidase AB [Neodiprion pinetum]|uniref:neutral alpha-glucosidase AB n=1 Tax=Neodiprion pinetum TaxID=441929 RepID=UPI001EDFF344|nr:neutral alpha-glucosidase AB [Neodiprion pinetum]